MTADALHCQRAHAQYLHERGAGFVFTAKHNQPTLFAALDALPWAEVPISHHDVGRRDVTETTRWANRAIDRPFKILKLIE